MVTIMNDNDRKTFIAPELDIIVLQGQGIDPNSYEQEENETPAN